MVSVTAVEHVITKLARADCLALLPSVRVGRVVFTHHALPAIRPVNFVVDDGDIVVRTGKGSALAAATGDAIVAFEVDEIDVEKETGWSVVVIGLAQQIVQPDIIDRMSIRVKPWGAPPQREDFFVRIRTELVSGRRIAQANESD